ASTLYHYRVWSIDAAGNIAISADNTFTTLPAADVTAPVLSGITASNFTSSGAVITWTTNEASNTQVEYGTTTGYGSSTTINATMVTSHSQTLSGLQANTLYHYRVKSRDAAGNLATSGDLTFTTSAVPDTTGPVISNVAAGNVTSSGAAITWTTNEAATSLVEYGTTTAYGASTALGATLVTGHSRTLGGLQPNTLYHYRVRSADAAGNESVSSDRTFTTGAAPDSTPPGDVEHFTAIGGDRRVTLSWVNPDDPDFVGVRIRYRTDRYPEGGNDGVLVGDFVGRTSESVVATHEDLQNGVTYYYSASSYDLSGNYQNTAQAFATPTLSHTAVSDGMVGGCGAVRSNGGSPPWAGYNAWSLVFSYGLLIGVGLLKWLRRIRVAWLIEGFLALASTAASSLLSVGPSDRSVVLHVRRVCGGYYRDMES
ncbi:MAG: fibronectin type III domain-containing protein, partial [Nitrospirota bacterium]